MASDKPNSIVAAPMVTAYGDVSWERMIRAMKGVHERLMRAVSAMESAKIPYAVAGDSAVAAWVSRVDQAAVRNTQDVDILLRRADLPSAIAALTNVGFFYSHASSLEMFLDNPNASPRDAVRIVFATEKVKADYLAATPDVSESETTDSFRLVSLEGLVKMKLTSFRDKDRTHLRDLIEVGLLNEAWLVKLPEALRPRLLELLANPEG